LSIPWSRCGERVARGRTVPASVWATISPASPTKAATCPPRSAARASPPPWKATERMSMGATLEAWVRTAEKAIRA